MKKNETVNKMIDASELKKIIALPAPDPGKVDDVKKVDKFSGLLPGFIPGVA